MKYLILSLFALPLLASCEMDNDFYEPAPPRVQVERNNHHQHESSSRDYYRAPAYRHDEERGRFVRPDAPRPMFKPEASTNTHQHQAAPAVRRAEADRNTHAHPTAPGVRIESARNTPRNTHGHSGPAPGLRKKPAIEPEARVEEQKNVHGHD